MRPPFHWSARFGVRRLVAAFSPGDLSPGAAGQVPPQKSGDESPHSKKPAAPSIAWLGVRGFGRAERCSALLFALVVLMASSPWLFAQPKITSLSPDWIQRGATLDVKLAGEGLNSVTGFVFSGEAGLSATVVAEVAPPPTITVESSSKSIGVVVSGEKDRSKSLRARITAAADAPLGAREVRALGPNGISAPLNITVGAVPEIAEVEPNNTIEQAQVVTVPSAVAGVIQSSTEIDSFKFAAKKGDQFILEVMAQRTGSPLDSSLAILDAKGKELARDEDARGFDSLVQFTAPEDGDYIAQLRDFQYRGGGDYKYRLFIGVLPFVDYIFPLGGQRGKPVEITVTGRNMQSAERVTLDIDASSPLGRQEIRLNTPRGLSNPIQFEVRDLPEFTEKEPNDGTNFNTVTAPVVINGRIGGPKDSDRFTFKAAVDGKLITEVEARRFGSPLDALLAVFAGETLVARNDDAAGSDARIEFDAKKDTEYTVTITDLTGRGGSNFAYRLAVRPPTAVAGASLAAKYFPDAVRVNRNGRTRVRCEIVRAGFDGPVRVAARDLPDGVSAEPIVIPAGRNDGDLLISATPDAWMGSAPLRVVASATSGGKELLATATAIEPQAAAERAFKQGFVSVLDTAPFTIDALTVGAGMDQLQSATIDVLVNRQAGFTQDVKITVIGFSAGREPINKSLTVKEMTVKSDARTAQLKLTATANSELGVRTVLVRGEATNNGQMVVQFSQPVAVAVTQIPFVLTAAQTKLGLNAARPGVTNFDDVTMKVTVERRGYAGEIPLTLTGVPVGVNVDGTNIAANAADTTLTFFATEQAKPTTNATITIQGAAMFNDRIYRHKTAGVRLVITPPAVEVATTNAVVAPKEP